MDSKDIGIGNLYRTKGTPAMGSFPAVPGEVVAVTGFETISGDEWCRVRFTDGSGYSMMHPSSLTECN